MAIRRPAHRSVRRPVIRPVTRSVNPPVDRPGRRARVSAAAMVVAATLLAGCGSQDDEISTEDDQRSATEAWADDLCTSVGTWGRSVADARTSLSNPNELSVADL